jgi:transcriptional regulator of acetoin/glycerol metabolism
VDASEALIALSRQRSLETHRLDPWRDGSPRVLLAGALRQHREAKEPLLHVARSGMESLFPQIRDAGYVVLLTDEKGVSVDFIGNPALDRELRRAGLYLGSCWQEEIEGNAEQAADFIKLGACDESRLRMMKLAGRNGTISSRMGAHWGPQAR